MSWKLVIEVLIGVRGLHPLILTLRRPPRLAGKQHQIRLLWKEEGMGEGGEGKGGRGRGEGAGET